MKTLEALMEELKESETLQQEFTTISSMEALESFLKKNDCEATTEDFAHYVQAQLARVSAKCEEGELSDEDVEAVAGGTYKDWFAWMFKEPGVSEEEGIAANMKNMNAMDAAVTTFFTETLPAFFTGGSSSYNPKAATATRMYTPQAPKTVKAVSKGTDINKNWR